MTIFHGFLAICTPEAKPALDAGWNACWDWGDDQFGVPLSNDGGETLTHYCFNDANVEPTMGVAWQATADGVWPEPLVGAWGQGGLPTEAELITASTTPGNLTIVHTSGTLADGAAAIQATFAAMNLVGYDVIE